MRKLLPVFIFLLLCSCAPNTYVSTIDKWKGRDKSELLMEWGIPDQSIDIEEGSQILQFSKQGYLPPSRGVSLYGERAGISRQGMSLYMHHLFWINKEGKVYHYLKQGGVVPPLQVDLSVFKR